MMDYANGRDELVGRLERLNSIIKPPNAPTILEDIEDAEEEPPGRSARSKRGKSGKSGETGQSGIADMFSRAAQKVFRRIHQCAGVLGIINPSDGRPQQEHCPDWAWFRPISFNRQCWIDVWPELQV